MFPIRLSLTGYGFVRYAFDNGRSKFGDYGKFPGLAFNNTGKYDAELFYLYYPIIVIDGKMTGINYLYSWGTGQIIQWNTL